MIKSKGRPVFPVRKRGIKTIKRKRETTVMII